MLLWGACGLFLVNPHRRGLWCVGLYVRLDKRSMRLFLALYICLNEMHPASTSAHPPAAATRRGPHASSDISIDSLREHWTLCITF